MEMTTKTHVAYSVKFAKPWKLRQVTLPVTCTHITRNPHTNYNHVPSISIINIFSGIHVNSNGMLSERLLHYIHLTDLFQDNLGKPAPERLNRSGFYWSKRWRCDSGISWTICKSVAPRSRQI